MKVYILLSVIIIIAAGAFFGYKISQKHRLPTDIGAGVGSDQSDYIADQEGKAPKSGDLCGGTGGIGQIINLGKNTITLKRKDGQNLITHLTTQTKINISTGSGSASDLKIGDKVTLVGGPNTDGSFTAEAVFVCNEKAQGT